jgi:hypothetical protein
MKNKTIAFAAALLALVAMPALAGEWHAGNNNVCTDCHTMHFSMQHGWTGGAVTYGTPAAAGNWLGDDDQGPNGFLLKLPANELCLTCHDGQTFAPDVLGANTNASPAWGRQAGALNHELGSGAYDTWMGHTLDSQDDPPGYNPGFGVTYNLATGELECINCHRQHGATNVYRNLLPRSGTVPGYAITQTRPANTVDVWVNIDPTTYTAGSGSAATFNPYYATQNIFFNKRATAIVTTTLGTGASVVNAMERICATCHGDFHGSAGQSFPENPATWGLGPGGVGGVLAATTYEDFIRHPSGQIMGTLGGGHSSMGRYQTATTKVKTYSFLDDYSDAVPGCLTCHKAHGNLNPFGLVFLNRAATAVNEEGGFGVTPQPPPGPLQYAVGYRNLCGQCHSQGNFN